MRIAETCFVRRLIANIGRHDAIAAVSRSEPVGGEVGAGFFRGLPECSGVYLMKGAADELLYVGKAKNLRQRLSHYRVANPDRMPRRHLRLLRAVERIEIQECTDEGAALEREAQLLRALRPRFNRAGTWPSAPRFLAIKLTERSLQLAVTPMPTPEGWSHGPMGSRARYLRAALVRLLWFAFSPVRAVSQMPVGWFRGDHGEVVTLDFSDEEVLPPDEIVCRVDDLLRGRPDGFISWMVEKLETDLPLFDKAVLEADLEYLADGAWTPQTAGN